MANNLSKIEQFGEDFSTLVCAKYSLVAVETSEEIRAVDILRASAQEKANATIVYEWSSTAGMRDEDGKPIGHDGKSPAHPPMKALIDIEKYELPEGAKGVFILKDFHPFMKAPEIQRKLRDLSSELKYTLKTIVFLSPAFPVPSDLQKSITVMDLPLPDAAELKEILCDALKGLKKQEQGIRNGIKDDPEHADELKPQLKIVNESRLRMEQQEKEYGDRIISAGLGLTAIEFEDVIAKCFVGGNLDIKLILSEKKQIIKKSGVLEYFDTAETASSIGGLKNLKQHISTVGFCLSEKAREFGIEPSKGFLLIGVPGGGKSLSAKVASNELQLPLIRMDIGSLFGSLVGESETRTRQALKLADAISPCIPWIDEIEKGMSFGDGVGDSGVGQRIFATLLTWMEESSGVFVVATCNSHKSLKPELMARFQKVFFVDVPTAKERREIITIHLAKIKRDPAAFDMEALIQASDGFVGREIRNVIQESLRAAFVEGKPLSTGHIVTQFGKTRPITVQKAEELNEMREWSGGNAESASEESDQPVVKSTSGSSNRKNRFESGAVSTPASTGLGLNDII